ncbi:hypothetical protein EU546_05160 [Candidatus Thorarchaeota archaeon]|nr:MAG: hypothetical protein EU546_05160 [Candidatus Thorarchaeota archaeon]
MLSQSYSCLFSTTIATRMTIASPSPPTSGRKGVSYCVDVVVDGVDVVGGLVVAVVVPVFVLVVVVVVVVIVVVVLETGSV